MARYSHTLRRVATNTGWTVGAMLTSVLAGVLQMGMLARLLGPERLGVLGLLSAGTALVGSTIRFTSAEAVITYTSRELALGSRAGAGRVVSYCFLLDFVSSFAAFAVFGVLGSLAGTGWGIPARDLSLVWVYGITLLVQSTFWVSHAVLRVTDRYRWTFFQTVTRAVIGVAGTAWLLVRHASLAEVVALQVGLAAVDGVVMFTLAAVALREQGISPRLRLRELARPPTGIWGFAVAGQGRGIVKALSRNLDTILIGMWGTPYAVGLYRAAKQIADQLQIPAQALVTSIQPEYSKLWYARDARALRRLVFHSVALLASVGSVGALIIATNQTRVVTLVLGPRFIGVESVLMLFVAGTLLNVMMTPVYSLLPAVGRPTPSLIAAATALVVQLVLLWIYLPRYGAWGGALASFVSVVVWSTCLLPPAYRVLYGRREPGDAAGRQAEAEPEPAIALEPQPAVP
jgi:O-antigen/teichoic acid export membrane protein